MKTIADSRAVYKYGLTLRHSVAVVFSGGTQRCVLFNPVNKYLLNKLLKYKGGSVSAPFTGTVYRVKYFKHIPKEINQDTSTV